MDAAVGVDAEEVAVVSGVMKSAQCQTIADLWNTSFLGIGDDEGYSGACMGV